MDIHQYEKRYKAAMNLLQKSNISIRNKDIIIRFKDALVLENISKPRIIRYIEIMLSVCKRLEKDLDAVTIDDMKKLIGGIQQQDFSPWTKHTYKVMIKRFYKWLQGTKEYPEIVSWISGRMSKAEGRLPSEGDLVTEDDIKKLINVAEHPRDKAFISILWESGARIGEIGNLRIKNVAFDKIGIMISVQGKTGSRKIRLISSTPYISTWISTHPQKDDPNAPLWINTGTRKHNSMMMYENMKFLLNRLFDRAGIKKRSNPHIFRHSRATFMANHLTEFQMNQYFGWIQGSDMPSTYVHMSGKEVDNAILTMNGLHIDDKTEHQKIQPMICPRCDTINAFDAKHCNKCGGILDLKYAMEVEERQEQEIKRRTDSDAVMNLLFSDKETQEFLRNKLRSLGLNISI
jgi:integrase/ribosomal protein L40E